MNLSFGKSLNSVGLDELHERHGVGVEIVRAGGVLRRVAAAGDVDHRRHIQFDHLLVDRIPPLVGQRRRVEVAAGRVGVEVAADEAQFLDAALQLGDRQFFGDSPGDLRQLADTDEVLRVERADAVRSGRCRSAVHSLRHRAVADVVAHAGGPRREDREVGAALALQLELAPLRCSPDLVVGHFQHRARGQRRLVLGTASVWSLRKRSRSLGSVV